MRQRGELGRDTERRKLLANILAPPTRSFQAASEPVGKSLLETNSAGGGGQRLIGDIRTPERQHPGFEFRQPVPLAGRQFAQCRFQRIAPAFDPALPLPPRQICGHIESLVNHAEMAVVVQHALARGDIGKYRHPERDVGLELSRPWKGLCRAGSARDDQDQWEPKGAEACLLA